MLRGQLNRRNSAKKRIFKITGVEQWAGLDSNLNLQSPNGKEVSENTNSERVQNRVHNTEFCAELQQILTASPELPERTKTAIKKLVETHGSERIGKSQ